MKLLNICVPTYNRPSELKLLAEQFLQPVIACFGDRVAAHIFDNSDASPAARNAELSALGISYSRNQQNVGFAGNVLNCATAGGARYLWVISDNDIPNLRNFSAMLEAIDHCAQAGVAALMLPFTIAFDGKEIGLRNDPESLGVAGSGRFQKFTETTDRIPFVLFSAVVLRTEGVDCAEVVRRIGSLFAGNDYIQIPLYWSIIPPDGRYAFFDKPALQYHEEFESRFHFPALVVALDRVIAWAPVSPGQKSRLRERHYRDWCLWLLRDRAGHRSIRDSDVLYRILWRQLPRNFSAKNLVALLLPLLPRFVARRVLRTG